ncbi:uncharacterized protein LOC134210034 [Armigeres subalbatus]|uniref:uncharacterized protein LOC134210034 n=1 Tax=Armigeres subalbatus TaxID=124917 RepID=UPI002ED54E51
MRDYLDMGHMRKVTDRQLQEEDSGMEGLYQYKVFYLPHHARPVIQDHLLNLLIRFRKYEVALVGDVEKMYRQVLHDVKDTLRLRILFRFSKEDPFGVYELLTVTYGLKPSSFLATRALQQLAVDEGVEGSPASVAVDKDFYVDDYIGGAASIIEATNLREDLTSLMVKGGFPIRKWCSNHPEVLAGVPEDQLGTSLTITFDLSPDEKVKTLGITWAPKVDQLRFIFNIENEEGEWTRRRILSAIARLFDPLGLISPVVVTAKIIMQQLALLHSVWDAPVPTQLEHKWVDFHRRLSKLTEFSIPRFAFVEDYVDVQLHCFADASDLAYGACL